MVDTLERKGYVKRTFSKTDKRKCEILITKSGKQVIEQVAPHLQKISALMESKLNEQEIKNTREVLQKIQETIQNS